jgi:hypothetical protein
VAPENVRYKGRLQPGRMFLVDIEKGRIVDDEEIKAEICAKKPYRQWLTENLVPLDRLPAPGRGPAAEHPAEGIRLQYGGSEDYPDADGR